VALAGWFFWGQKYFETRNEARQACQLASEGIVLTAAIILSQTIENADDPQAMAQAIRNECPEIVFQLLRVGEQLDDLGS
jgi:hypothetical protein